MHRRSSNAPEQSAVATALPANLEAGIILFSTGPAIPGLSRGRLLLKNLVQNNLGARIIRIIMHPQFWPGFKMWHFTTARAQVLVFKQGRNAFRLNKVLNIA